MAEYHFDDLAKKAGIGNSAPSSALSPEKAEQEMGRMKFRFSVTDGYLTEKGGQFDYVFDFARHTFERSDWRSGGPVTESGKIPEEAADHFIKAAAFILTIPQSPFRDKHQVHGSEYRCLGAGKVRSYQTVYPMRAPHGGTVLPLGAGEG